MSFRVQSKEFSLTYPKCTVIKEDLLNHLKQERNSIYVCVAKELHEDGQPHLHAHIIYNKRKDIKNAKYFDIQGFHCNIQATENSEAWNKYVKEDGDFIEHGEREVIFNLYEQARNGNHDEFFESARTNKICFQYAMEAWRTANQVDTTINDTDIIDGSYNEFLNWYKYDEPFKTNVIVGETGTGKTVFAKTKATKPTLFCSHIDDLKSFKPNFHKSIIFDDMSFSHLPTTAQIHLVDRYETRSIHVRYGVARIPKGVERWITCNSMPLSEHPAIRRRINLINLY